MLDFADDSRMRLGILSDSHGRIANTALAVRALLDCGAEVLLHLGDIESTDVLDELVGQAAAGSHVVFGNCDDEASLARYAEVMGLQVDHPMGRLTCDGKVIAFTHGHINACMQEAMREGVEYLLHGHTHQVRDERVGGTRIINPGALFRARRYTAAVLDPAADELQFIEISAGR